MAAAVARLPPGAAPVLGSADVLYSILASDESGEMAPGRPVIYENGSPLPVAGDGWDAYDIIEGAIRLQVAERTRDRVFIHAGVVAEAGRAVVMPGRSHAGKSRLVAALVGAGATYYSDEYAVFDSLGRVHPFPSPLSLRRGNGHTLRVPLESIGRVGRCPLPVALIAFAEYCPGGCWRPREIPAGLGVLGMLDNALPARSRPSAVLDVLARVRQGARVLAGMRGEAEEAAADLLASLRVVGGAER